MFCAVECDGNGKRRRILNFLSTLYLEKSKNWFKVFPAKLLVVPSVSAAKETWDAILGQTTRFPYSCINLNIFLVRAWKSLCSSFGSD